MKSKPSVNKGEKSNFRKYIILFWLIVSVPLVLITVIFTLISGGYIGFMPSFEELENPKSNLASEIFSSDGQLLGTYYIENRSNITYEELSPYLVDALIATEDVRFKDHSGIDFRSIGRVVVKTIIGGDQSSGGGSTISQQLAKMLFPREANQSKLEFALRKLKEWIIAIKLEKRYTKEEIIAMYFNKFDFLNLAVGVKSSARVYFNTTPDSLKLEEAAMLVGMAKNPAFFNPIRRPDTTLNRRNVVLAQMVKYDYITQETYDSLKQIPLKLDYQKVDHKEGIATYFREYLRTIMNAKEPDTDNYIDKIKYHEDSLEWANNSLYGWCNKNKKPDGTSYDLYKDGLKIYTTINFKMQKYAEEAVNKHLGEYLQKEFFKEQKGRSRAPFSVDVTEEQIDQIMDISIKRSDRYKKLKSSGMNIDDIKKTFYVPTEMSIFSWKGEIDTIMRPIDSIRYYKSFIKAGLMSVEPETGFVRAYVGGINYKHFQFDQVKIAKRQVGSTFKPFLYTLAMQEGYSPCYKVPNIPTTFKSEVEEQPDWTPKNSDITKMDGKMVTLQWGLANSVNNISAWLMKQFKPQAVINIARKMGVFSQIPAVPSICLGVADITLAEMVGAYNTFASKGVYIEPIFLTRIEDKNGNVISTFKPHKTEAVSEQTAFLMLNLLENVVLRGTSMRVRFKYGIYNQIAAKTGTSQNQSDGWYMGVAPKLTSGVWVGCEDRSVHFQGIYNGQAASTALPIWAYYMQKVYADKSLGYSTNDTFIKPEKGISVETDCGKYDDEQLQEKTDVDESNSSDEFFN